MIAGHFGLAAGVKGRQRQVPLWALMLATVWLDIVFAPLLAAGVETIENVPGTSGGYGKAIIHADWTHSLVGALVLATLFGLVAARPWGRLAGAVLGAVVFSHWLLDLVVHRGDLPILPGNAGDLPRLGFGLVEATGGLHPGRAGPGRGRGLAVLAGRGPDLDRRCPAGQPGGWAAADHRPGHPRPGRAGRLTRDQRRSRAGVGSLAEAHDELTRSAR